MDVSSNFPQKRHPERSASQTYRVTQSSGAESKDLGGVNFTQAAQSFSTTKDRTGASTKSFSGDEKTRSRYILLRPVITVHEKMSVTYQMRTAADPGLGLQWSKNPEPYG
jgi:hypothetical protein